MPIAVASTLSPAGTTCAGRHGAGVLSVASYSEQGLTALATQWTFAEEAASEAGRATPPDRKDWRIVMPFHIAETREQAISDIEDGILAWNNEYFIDTIGSPANQPANSGREMADRLIVFGAIIGTPDDAIAGIRRLQETSGGFGCLLGLAHEWTTWEKTLHSYELMARYVMPQFRDSLSWIDRSAQWTGETKGALMDGAKMAVMKAIGDHAAARAELPKTELIPGLHRIAPDEAKVE
jgi:limonene 1,2-monooxygenase